MKKMNTTIKKLYIYLLLLFFSVGQAYSQNYIQLADLSGLSPSTSVVSEIESEISEIIDLLPSAYKDKFKVYDFGFYTVRENTVGGFDEAWTEVQPEFTSPYYVSFGRESTSSGVNERIRVELKLPSKDEFDCFDEEKRIKVERYVEVHANGANNYDAYLAELEALKLLRLYVENIIICECHGIKSSSGCDLYGNYDFINAELLAHGFRKRQIGIGDECTWSNGSQEIYDYSGKEVIIDGESYCIGDQLSEGKALLDAEVSGAAYILDNESFVNGEWDDAKAAASSNDYVEYWAVIEDTDSGKYYLYSMFTLGEVELPAIAGKEQDELRKSTSLNPFVSTLKLLGNAAIDACMQAIIIRVVDKGVRAIEDFNTRWTEAFKKVSYWGAAWEGVSSLIPWKKKLGPAGSVLRAATSAFAVVLDKWINQPGYTAGQGFVDFAIGFGASGLTQIITPKLGQYGGRIISEGLDSWYEKSAPGLIKTIIFQCSKNFDDYTSRVVKSQKYVNESELINGVQKIDLMGGNSSQLGGDFVNIDLRETIRVGIKGDATKLSQFIPKNSIDEIVTNNPYLGGSFNAEDYIKEVAEILSSGKKIFINGQTQNKYFNNVDEALANKYGLTVESFQVSLLDRFRNLSFQTTNGANISTSTMKTTVLIKN